jgi:hypothetical protein
MQCTFIIQNIMDIPFPQDLLIKLGLNIHVITNIHLIICSLECNDIILAFIFAVSLVMRQPQM